MFIKKRKYDELLYRISKLEKEMSKMQEDRDNPYVPVKDIYNKENYYITAYEGKLYFIKNPHMFQIFDGCTDGIQSIDEAIKTLREDRDFLFKEFVDKK
jgi:hypothetical protein